MIKNKIVALITVFIVLILSSFVSAITEDFRVTGASEISVYECIINQDGMIHVTNTGDIPSGYTISIGGSGAKFVSLGPSNFILEPGQTQDVLSFFTVPCGSRGEYDLDVYINTVLDTKKILNQKIIVEKPRNIKITPVIYSQKIEPCGTASYQFNINNTGSFDETYSVTFQKPFGGYASVNFNQVILTPGQEVPLYITLRPSCEIYGNYTIPFSIKTSNTKEEAKTFSYLLINKAYDYSLELGNLDNYQKNLTQSFISHNNGEIYSLCSNSIETIPIKIKNNANITNAYSIKLGQEIPSTFVSLSTTSIELNKSREKIIGININTANIEGDFNFALDVLSNYGKIQKSENITLSIGNCYKPNLLTADGQKSFVLDYEPVKVPITVINTGSKKADYVFSLNSFGDWLTVDPSKLTVDAGKTGTTYIVSNPSEIIKRGTYKANIQIDVDKTNVVYSDYFKINLVTMNAFDRFYYYFLIPHIWYFIAGILGLIILIILAVIFFRRLKTKLSKIKERKALSKKTAEKKVKPKISRLKLIFWILLLLLLILFAAFMIFKDKILANETVKTALSFITTNIIPAVKTFFVNYWVHIVIGLAALVLLLLLFFIIKKFIVKRRLKKQRTVKAEKTVRKKGIKLKISKKLLLIIFGILILAGLGYLIYYFSAWQYVANLFAKNETVSAIEKNVTEQVAEQTGPSLFSTIYTKICSFFGNIWTFIVNNLFYVLLAIAIIVLLLIIFLIIRHIRKKNMSRVDVESASDEIALRNNNLSCGEIIVKLKNPVNYASLILKKVRKPTFIGAGELVYEYFEIDKKNLDNSDIKEVILRFRVRKSWLKRNSVRRSDISLKRYHNKWLGVNTKIIAEDNKYVYYESDFDHLSYFAIVGKRTEQKPEKKAAVYQKPAKKTKINLGWLKKIFWPILIILLLLGLGFLVYHFWGKIIEFLKTYLAWILWIIALLVIIALTPLIIKLIKWLKKKLSKKLKKLLLIILLILIMLALLALGLAYIVPKISMNLTDVLSVEYAAQNDSAVNATENNTLNQISNDNISLTEETVQDNISEEKTEGIPDIEFESGSNFTINLSKYFIDPDGDKLTYSHSQLEHINISYDGDNAILVPEEGFGGSEFVIFTADDSKGGKVDSNIIKLTVEAAPEPTFLYILSNRIFHFKP